MTTTPVFDPTEASRVIDDIDDRYSSGSRLPFPVGVDLAAALAIARWAIAVADRASYLHGEPACIEEDDCEHMPDDEEITAGAVRPTRCPAVEVRYATTDDALRLAAIREHLVDAKYATVTDVAELRHHLEVIQGHIDGAYDQ